MPRTGRQETVLLRQERPTEFLITREQSHRGLYSLAEPTELCSEVMTGLALLGVKERSILGCLVGAAGKHSAHHGVWWP